MTNFAITQQEIDFFEENGYLIIHNLISEEALEEYQNIYNDFISGKIDVGANRRDLKGEDKESNAESITQIMVPSKQFPSLKTTSYYKKISEIAHKLLGEDLEIDFDMLINKPPFSNAITPWHQDCAYWIDMPDKRAISAWMPLDKATLDNGCMWYVPGSHKLSMRKHESTAKNGALVCEATENEAIYVELEPGSVVLHHGATVHYSRGNTTNSQRRAMIVNLRPKSMIKYERERGFDHTGENKVRNEGEV
ncbi:phytanoyl-CoA dioxygenase family protein [Draconibacterium sp.]|nr:phytanoyl-CoA dioxygenase family protein [Draconibacterium sp.]